MVPFPKNYHLQNESYIDELYEGIVSAMMMTSYFYECVVSLSLMILFEITHLRLFPLKLLEIFSNHGE